MTTTLSTRPDGRRAPAAVLSKLEELRGSLETGLDNPGEALELLVSSVAKGAEPTEVFDALHRAAQRFDQLFDLAFSYEHVAGDKRVKLLAPEQQAYLLLQAAAFVGDVLGHAKEASQYAERALYAVPGNEAACELLERWLGDAASRERLTGIYLNASRRVSDVGHKLALSSRAVELAFELPPESEVALEVLKGQIELDPRAEVEREELMSRYLSNGRHADAIGLLESALEHPGGAEAKPWREQLLGLYVEEGRPDAAIAHVEELLALDPEHAAALRVAEGLVEHRVAGARAAAALSQAYDASGRVDSAIEMLSLELKRVRGLRRVDVQRRLGVLRQDVLGDRAGALSLLGPVVAGDPGDDDLRRRFIELSLSLDQPQQAARLLARALSSSKDPSVRTRVSADVGAVFLKTGDVRRAQVAFEQALEIGADPAAVLRAARELAELYAEGGDTARLAGALELVVKHEPEPEARQDAARRLARLAETSESDEARAVVAYRALLDSPWSEEALERLEKLCEKLDDQAGLADALEYRASRASDRAAGRELLFQAALKRSERTTDRPAALGTWRRLLDEYGPDREVLSRLIPLLEQAGAYTDLASALRHQIELCTAEERPALFVRLGQLYVTELADPAAAVEAFERALELDPEERASRAALDRLLAEPSVALRAAAALERVCRNEAPRSSLVRVLAVRALHAESVGERLTALREGVKLCSGPVRDFEQGLRLANMGIALSLEQAPEELETWLDRFQVLGEQSGQAELRAKLLQETLGERAVESRAVFELTRATGEALASAGDVDRALELLQLAVAFDPAPQLVQRIDELLAQQGSPEERFALYQSALSQETRPERRREFLHATAALQAREFGDLPAAIATWQRALSEDATDMTARQALVNAYETAGDAANAYAELERLMDHVGGDRRTATLLRMAELAERLGDDERALSHYRDVLGQAGADARVLSNAERLARKLGDSETVIGVLSRALEGAGESLERIELFERLGEAHAELRGDVDAAQTAWLAAARLAEGSAEDRSVEHRLYARVHAVSPDNWRAGTRLFELSAELGDWATAEAVFEKLAEKRKQEAAGLLLSIAARASTAAGAVPFARMVELALPNAPEPSVERQLLSAKARAVAGDPARLEEAAALYRALLESGGAQARADAEAFEALLEGNSAPEAVRQLRWLYQWQVDHATDPTLVLGKWAELEEQRFSAPEQAAALYEKLVAADSDRVDAYLELARLRGAIGDGAGAVEALNAVRARTEGEARASAELKIARLLLGALGQPGEALGLLASLLEANPGDREALVLAREALALAEVRLGAAQILEQVASATDDQGLRTEVLEALLEATRGSEQEELLAARRRWLKQLLDTERDDPAEALRVALRAAEEEPSDLGLWDAAERFARALDRPDPVAEAYARVLDGALEAELGEVLGRRTVEFFEEWFDDSERVVHLLERVLGLSPGAAWAFDRLKLAFNAAGRWRELFDLYDRQLRVLGAEAKIEVLREAAMAAKDFAGDAGRAIDYLEKLDELTPEDARIELALERLYEREGRSRSLIDLYSRQLDRADAPLSAQLRGRIARLWLELAEPLPALAVLETMIELDPDSASAVELLEGLVQIPESRDSMVPSSAAPARGKGRKKRVTPQQTVKERAAGHLRVFYRRHERIEDVVRMLEIEVETALTDEDRVRRLREVTKVRLEELGDAAGAFEDVSMLVRLAPEVERHRAELAELAERTGQHERRSELLVTVADEASDTELQASLLTEAAATCRDELGAADVATELYLRVLRLAGDESPRALEAARAVTPLLTAAERWETCCAVLERLAVLEAESAARCEGWRAAAEIAFEHLGDADRAAHNYRRRLSELPGDRPALDGLVDALDRGQRWSELVRVLDERATLQISPETKRADLVRVAKLHIEQRGDADASIDAWRVVRDLAPADDESFLALRALLYDGQRWQELAELIRDFASLTADKERRAELLTELGEVHRARTGDRLLSLRAFVEAERWDRAIEVAGSAHPDRTAAQSVCAELLELAFAAWTREAGSAESAPAKAAAWALGELSQRLLEEGRHEEVVDLLLRGSEWPFEQRKRRELLREAACLCSDRLGDAARAIELFTRLFAEDRADEVASASVTRLSLLFEEQGRHEEVVSLWEGQAQCRAAAGDRSGAAALWARAGELAEERLSDEARAVADYRHGAGLGGESSLEALARIHTASGDWLRTAEVLEWLCAQSAREALGSRALRLAEAYLALGEPDKARARLESAAELALEAAPVRARLAELYREAERFTELAQLLAAEAGRATDARKRLELLKEAARLHQEERDDPAAAAPLLREALALAPDEAALRMKLAAALTAAERFDEAAEALSDQIERYGQRRPKERAVVHFELAKVLLKAQKSELMLEQLELASKIDPAHPAILSMLARHAFEAGELERAEQMYRALLLVAGRGVEASRAEALLDLSEIATRRGDAVRAAEFVESAFEAALESAHEAAALERSLRSAGRPELLARAIELRLNQALSPAEAARVLSDLVMLQAGGASPTLESAEVRRRVDALRSELDAYSDDDAWAALGRIYDWLGDPHAEAEILERRVAALEAEPRKLRDAEPFYRLASVRLSAPETRTRGFELVERALEVQPDIARALEMTRRALDDHGPDPAGLGLLERLSRMSDDPRVLAESLLEVARLPARVAAAVREGVATARKLGDEVLERALLERMLSHEGVLAPADLAWTQSELSTLLEASGEIPRALSLRELAAEALEGAASRAALLELVSLARAAGDLDRAVRVLEALREREPADTAVWQPLLEIYRQSQDDAALLSVLEQTIPLVDSLEIRCALRREQAELTLKLPDGEGAAVSILEDLLRDDPAQPEVAARLAELLRRLGQEDKLAELIRRELDEAKDRQDIGAIIELTLELGGLLERQGARADAIDVYRSALDWDARNVAVLRAFLGVAESAADPFVIAEVLESLIELESGSAAVEHGRRLSRLRQEQGDTSGANRALELAFAKEPDPGLCEELLERLLAVEDFQSAAAVLARAVESDASNVALVERWVEVAHRARDREGALSGVERLLEQRPDDSALLRRRGALLLDLGRRGEALAVLERAFSLEPSEGEELVRALEQEQEDRPDASEPAERLVQVLVALGDAARARKTLAHWVDRANTDAPALRRLAELQMQAEDWAGAVESYARLAELVEDATLLELVPYLSQACERAGTPERARPALERAHQTAPEDPAVSDWLRWLYETTGANWELSQLLLEEVGRLGDPLARHPLLVRVGELLLSPEGNTEEGIRILEEARQIDPHHIEGGVLLARGLSLVGQNDRALDLLSEIAAAARGKRSRRLARIYEEIARIQLLEGFLTDALDALLKAHELDLKNAKLAVQLGKLALDIDEDSTAQRAFRAVTLMKPVADSPNSVTPELRADAQYGLASLAKKHGDQRKARILVAKALSEDPTHERALELSKELG